MESLLNDSVHEENKSEASNSSTGLDKQTMGKNDADDKIVIDSYLLMDSLNNYVYEDNTFKTEDSSVSTSSDEFMLVGNDFESKTCSANLSTSVHKDTNFKTEDSYDYTTSENQTLVRNELQEKMSTADYLPVESLLNNNVHKNEFESEVSFAPTSSSEHPSIMNIFEQKILPADYVPVKSMDNNVHEDNFKTKDNSVFTSCSIQTMGMNDFEDQMHTANYSPVESLLNSTIVKGNCNTEGFTSKYKEKILAQSDFESKMPLTNFYLPTDPSFDNFVPKDVFKPDVANSLTSCDEETLRKSYFDGDILTADYNLSIEVPSNNYTQDNNSFKFYDQQSLLDPFSIIMHCRNEIDELSEKYISNFFLQKERFSEQYGAQYVNVIKQRLKNLSLQQTQFESIISDTKVQLSSAYISNHEDIVKSSKSIVKYFEQQCRLFEHFFPSFAFKNEVLSSLENNQVLIVSADSYYSFNSVLPIFIKNKYPEKLLVCCENCEFTRSWLYEFLVDFLGNKVVTNLNHKKSIKNQVVCFTEEEMLECFSDKQYIFQQEMCIVVNIPLIRTVTCDILLANFYDMLKVNKESKLILLLSSFAEILDYEKYFSKLTLVSVLKTKCLRFPITTVRKNNDLTPTDDYIEEVVRTILAILVLKEVGDILAFLPLFEDLEYAVEMLNLKLFQIQDKNIEFILIHENAFCDFDSLSSTDSIRRVFLSTNCGEALFLPSVQHVIDCGIKNIYVFDAIVKTDMLETTFISCQNANLRKNMAGSQQPGVYYQIYSKNNYRNEMPRKNLPEVLVISPLNTMMKMFQYRPYNAANTTFVKSFSEKIKLDTLKTLQACGVVENNHLTSLGENIVKLPFEPNYSKLILLALEQSLAFEAIVLVSFFTSNEDIFLYSDDINQQRKIDATKLQLTQNDGDTLSYLYIYKICMENQFSKGFCENQSINYEALQNISCNVMDLLSIVNSCLGVNVPHKFSDETNSFVCVTELLFQCFQVNLCVFSGHTGSGYKVLQSSNFAFVHSSSLIYQWKILPQFIIYDRVDCVSKGLVHITAISDDIIMNSLSNETLKYNFEDLFEQILLKRTIEPIGEELMNEMTKGENNENLKVIESQVRKECGNNFIFLDLNIQKGQVHIYALPNYIDNAHCVIDDIIKSMLDDILNENRIEVLELKKGQNKVCVEVSWSKGAVASSVALSNQSSKSYESNQETTISNNVNDYVKESIGFPYYLHFSWLRRYCIGEGYVTFGDKESFLEARKLGLKTIKILRTDVFVQLRDKEKYQLCITGLPPDTCSKNLKKELHLLLPNSKIDNIELKCKNPFETSDEDIEKFKALITMKCIEYDFLDQCDIVIPKPDAQDLDMVAYIYTYNNEILDFVADVLSTEFVNNKETITDVRFNVNVRCSPDIYKALKPCFNVEMAQLELDLERQTGNRTDLDFSFHIDDKTEDKVMFKLSSNNNELLKLLHRTINNLLAGEILSTKNIIGLENLFFYGGHLWLRNLEKTENLYILEDNHKKEIRLYGSRDSCYNAKSQMIAFLEDAENDVMLTIPLCNDQNSSLLLKAIIKEYGINLEVLIESCALRSALLDIKARQLLLRGSRDTVTKAENTIKSLSKGLDMTNITSGQSQEICPVCSCPASNLAFRLEHCGHLYCLECIQALIEQAQFPVCCCAEKCSKDIVLKDIKKVLKDDAEKIKILVEKSMKDYLERNRTNIAFCPVADCSMFFNKAEVSRNKANCRLCLNEICIRCNVLYHGGYTCEMYQNSKKDPDYSFKMWQKTTSQCKQCPRCKTAIEKIAGCNRMLCTSCKGRFCWICVQEFPTDQDVYNHIHAKHSGMLFAQVV